MQLAPQSTEFAPIDVAMATDAAYAQHAAVVVRSLLCAHAHRSLRFHFLCDREAPAELAPLRLLVGTQGEFNHVRIPESWARRLSHHPKFGYHAWLRLLLPEVLPALDRVLYLDSDVVVNGALDDLWASDLRGRPVGAVANPLYPHQSDDHLRALGIERREAYFNSGVLLMDLACMRKRSLSEKLVEFAIDRAALIHYPDQDTLNALLWNDWQPLHPRYNAQTPLFELRAAELPYSASEIAEARRSPAIIHFTGMHKPWLDACRHPYRRLYWRHLKHTAWSDAKPLYPRWSNAILRLLPYRAYRWVWRRFPQRELVRQVSPK